MYGRIAASRRIENCPVSIRPDPCLVWWVEGEQETGLGGRRAGSAEGVAGFAAGKKITGVGVLVINHIVRESPFGSVRRTPKTGCSERIRANSGAGLIGSSGSRCERRQDSGSDVVVMSLIPLQAVRFGSEPSSA
jgi:hypothetical protein